jgi:hypothetical protein
MPEISRFLGIIIYMHFNEHNPPHFHAKYGKYRAIIDIKNLGIIEGKLPARVLAIVVEWAKIHQKELMKNWYDLTEKGIFNKIKPLV